MHYTIQEIVNTIAARLPAPVSLTDPQPNSLVFGPHDEETIDPVRRRSLLNRVTESWVRDWFFAAGIAEATEPVRVPARPSGQGEARCVVPSGTPASATEESLLRATRGTSSRNSFGIALGQIGLHQQHHRHDQPRHAHRPPPWLTLLNLANTDYLQK